MKRLEVYRNFKKFVMQKDNRTMDEICTPTQGFKLQVQQEFLRDYMRKNPDWRSLLLFQAIGSGKTCTAITMTEEFLRSNPVGQIKVILPARLRTNFIDELISPCANWAYISKENYEKFVSQDTSARTKSKIKEDFMKAIEKKYKIYSFERLKIEAIKSGNLKDWVVEFTRNSMIVIDEVHNMMSDKYEVKKSQQVLKTGDYIKGLKGFNTVLFKLLTAHAHSTSKMIFLTATPIFDNIAQIKEIVYAMNPTAVISGDAKLSSIIDLLRGRVSYFPGTSVNAYPKVSYKYHNIPLSATQDELTNAVQGDDFGVYIGSDDEDNDRDGQFGGGDDDDLDVKESFMAKQRQISIACLPNQVDIKKSIKTVISNMSEYCPKVKQLVKEITKNQGKHMVYSSYVQSGLKVVEASLQKAGWQNIMDVIKSEDLVYVKNKVYAVWDGHTKDADKQLIKNIVNSKDNMTGEKIKVILGSPSVKEGVSFKHIQHLHLLDPVWNESAKTQVEGRALRFCSHVDIPRDHKTLKREVLVHIYKIMPRKYGLVAQTCDQVIYDIIIPKKKKLVQAGENALKKVAIDHYLFRKMYSNEKFVSPKTTHGSPVEFTEEENVHIGKPRKARKANTCPKKRRPDEETGECFNKDDIIKKNNQGHDCCYKQKKTKTKKEKTSCPKKRQPIDGKCTDGFKVKTNKAGEPCCYKKTKTNT